MRGGERFRVGVFEGGGWTVRAVHEMPRLSVAGVTQAQGTGRIAKNELPRGRKAAIPSAEGIEQLLHKIKANRRREIL